jgi:hypothetical protein
MTYRMPAESWLVVSKPDVNWVISTATNDEETHGQEYMVVHDVEASYSTDEQRQEPESYRSGDEPTEPLGIHHQCCS